MFLFHLETLDHLSSILYFLSQGMIFIYPLFTSFPYLQFPSFWSFQGRLPCSCRLFSEGILLRKEALLPTFSGNCSSYIEVLVVRDLLLPNIFPNMLKIKITHSLADVILDISILGISESWVVKNKSAKNTQSSLAGSFLLFGQLWEEHYLISFMG